MLSSRLKRPLLIYSEARGLNTNEKKSTFEGCTFLLFISIVKVSDSRTQGKLGAGGVGFFSSTIRGLCFHKIPNLLQ